MESIVIQPSNDARPDHPTVPPAQLDDKGNITGSDNQQPPAEKLILDKFKTQDDLVKAYQELERKLSEKPAEKPQDAPADPTAAARQALKDKGLEFDKYAKEFLSNGDLSDGSYKELLDKGLTMSQVRQFIDGQKALADQNTQKVYENVGGKESFDKLLEFAKTSLSAQEIAAYNAAAERGDIAAVNLIMTGVQSRYNEHFGTTPNLIKDGVTKPSNVGGDTYGSLDEYYKDVQDPRYKKDPVYRKALEDKLTRSAQRLRIA